jgi:hypothetical protein
MEFYKGYESSTHQPLIRAVLEAYKPDFVLELGVGDFSTPLLSKVENYMGIENDHEWIERIKGDYVLSIYHHAVDFGIGTQFRQLSEYKKEELKLFYRSIVVPLSGIKLLFVDNWTGCRTIAINELRNKFDLIIFHDCQPEGVFVYNYDLIDTDGFEICFLKSPISWTALMYKEERELNIDPFIAEYVKEWPDASPMKLTKRYL